jgi:adenosine deaminase
MIFSTQLNSVWHLTERTMQLASWIKGLPKAELHLHIEGTLEPELMMRLAKKNKVKLPYNSVEEIRRAYQFNNLQSFLDIYYAGANALQDEDDFRALAAEYFAHCKEDNIVHAELFFDPQTHTDRGIDIGVVIRGLRKAQEDAEKQHGISSQLILCFLRHLSEDEALKTLAQAEPFLKYIKGVGLDSSEKGHPPSKFQRVFAKAASMGLKCVAHAGEEGPPEYIWEALNLLKVERIDHGVRSEEDPKLVQLLVEKKMPLTVCPLSNVKLKVFQKLKDHNLKRLLHKGVCITLNSDDPAYFGGYLQQNYLETAEALDLSRDDIKRLAINSFQASWLDAARRDKFIQQIENA